MKIFIFGATGMLGHKMYQILQRHFGQAVYGVVRCQKSDLSKYNIFDLDQIFEKVDVENAEAVQKFLNAEKPDWILNCTGITLRKTSSVSSSQIWKVNTFFPKQLKLWAEVHQKKVINFSTDCVFDGERGDYTELDFPSAENEYGKSKFCGEMDGPNSLTLRTSFIGRELHSKTELLEWFLAQKNKSIKGFSKVIYNGVTTHIVAKEVIKIIQFYPYLSGLYHLSSVPESKFNILQLVNKAFSVNVSIEDDASKISNKALNCDKYILKTEYKRPSWPEMIAEIAADTTQY